MQLEKGSAQQAEQGRGSQRMIPPVQAGLISLCTAVELPRAAGSRDTAADSQGRAETPCSPMTKTGKIRAI